MEISEAERNLLSSEPAPLFKFVFTGQSSVIRRPP
jgi:hypothetical protein